MWHIPELPDPDENPLIINALEVYRIAEQKMPEIRSAELDHGEFRKRTPDRQRRAVTTTLPFGQLQFRLFRYPATGGRTWETRSKSPSELPRTLENPCLSYPQEIPIYGAYPFFEQIRDNTSAGVGLGLSIPIFNGWQVNTSIANARICTGKCQPGTSK